MSGFTGTELKASLESSFRSKSCHPANGRNGSIADTRLAATLGESCHSPDMPISGGSEGEYAIYGVGDGSIGELPLQLLG